MTESTLNEEDLQTLADRVLGGAEPSSLMVRAVEVIVARHVAPEQERREQAEAETERLTGILDPANIRVADEWEQLARERDETLVQRDGAIDDAEKSAAEVERLAAEVRQLRELHHIGIELDNHHNAAVCPYCSAGRSLVEPRRLADLVDSVRNETLDEAAEFVRDKSETYDHPNQWVARDLLQIVARNITELKVKDNG